MGISGGRVEDGYFDYTVIFLRQIVGENEQFRKENQGLQYEVLSQRKEVNFVKELNENLKGQLAESAQTTKYVLHTLS